MNYKDLEVWKIASELSIETHKMTLALPKFEMYEEAARFVDHPNQFVQILSKVMEGADIKTSLYDILYLQSHQPMKQLIILKFCLKQNL
jgi:hypothetical protein